ncbi:MAG: hypothetical protein H6737_07330 [Alphaproteobacteria bacterium]|nr:hypothetical protein [Alphaproteobacteria bacterium]
MKQLVAGILIGAVLVLGAGGGYLAWKASTPSPAEAMCTHLLEVCEPDPEQVNAYADCVQGMDEFVASAKPEDVTRLETCVLESEGCAQASGCVAGAGLKQAFGEVGEFFKGMGNALGFGKDR